MRYAPRLYARALVKILGATRTTEAKLKVLKRLITVVKRHGDERHLTKIAAALEQEFLKQSGRRRVTIETARPLAEPEQRKIQKLLQPTDVVTKEVLPELMAGFRLTINNERQLDGTLQKKLNCLISNFLS